MSHDVLQLKNGMPQCTRRSQHSSRTADDIHSLFSFLAAFKSCFNRLNYRLTLPILEGWVATEPDSNQYLSVIGAEVFVCCCTQPEKLE